MKILKYILLSAVLLIASCQKDEMINNFPAEVSFDITAHLLEGKRINCIETTDDGKAWIGSGKELYLIDGNKQKLYTIEFNINDIAIGKDQTIWIGSDKGGLGQLEDGKFTWYNTINAGLPRDYVRHVDVAPDGKIWFTSCASQLGGLGIYDGESFEFLTPDNSPLNYNIIDDIHIDPEGRVYIATSGTVGKSNIYRISKNKWECLGNEDGTFYWVFSFALGLDETICRGFFPVISIY
jgi:ligand-binding sensor domain-containing protein